MKRIKSQYSEVTPNEIIRILEEPTKDRRPLIHQLEKDAPAKALIEALTWLIFASRQGLKRKFSFDPLIITGLAAITLQMLLFFKIPLEISYQLPLLFIALPLLTYLFAFSGRNLLLLLGLTVIYAFVVNIDLLDRRYNADGTEAVSAAPGLFFRAGVVVNDIASRKESQKRYFDEYGIQLR